MASQAARDEAIREHYLIGIEKFLLDLNEDVKRVPLTEESVSAGFKLALPTVDEDNNERTVIIKIEIPRGKRDGTEYDVYAEAQRYLDNLEEIANNKKVAAENKLLKEKRKRKSAKPKVNKDKEEGNK